jgi:hypothetical protein
MILRALPVALLLSLALISRAHAYPIEPRTLWELTKESELIVLAEVEAVEEYVSQGADSSRRGDVARLRIIEVWKGTKPERLEVRFRRGMVCPAPPRYEPGRRVVAFLKRYEDTWRTTGLSYGTHYPPDDGAVEAYWQSVRQALAAQESPLESRRVEWAVRTALHPSTRWDGLYMLAPSADELHAFFDSRDPTSARLSQQQLKLLADAFVQAPTRDRTLSLMLAVLRDHPSNAVDTTALSALETILREPEGVPWWTEQTMKLVARRLGKPLLPPEPSKPQGDKASKEEAEAEEETHYEGHDAFSARMRQQWEAFKKANQLSPTPLSIPPRRGPTSVGGETPP